LRIVVDMNNVSMMSPQVQANPECITQVPEIGREKRTGYMKSIVEKLEAFQKTIVPPRRETAIADSVKNVVRFE